MTSATTNPETIPLSISDANQSPASSHDGKGPRSLRSITRKDIIDAIKDNVLILATFLGIVLGFCLGMGIRELKPSPDALTWLGLPGELFLRSLKMTIVPLLVSLIINTTASFNPRSNGKIATVAILGFVITQLIATVLAILLFFVFRPEARDAIKDEKLSSLPLRTSDVFADLIRNLFPDNVVRATIAQTVTSYSKSPSTSSKSYSTNATEVIEKSVGTTDGINILGLITICATVGVAANLTTPDNGSFRTFFKEVQHIMMLVVRWLFWTTPVGVASLIAKSIAGVEDVTFVFETLGLLIASVTVGLTVHLLIIMPALIFVLARRNPYVCLVNCAKPYMIAFASTASSVALPDMLVSSEKCGVRHQVSHFVIPMSIALHADGSSLYMASSALFIGQISNSLVGTSSYFIIGVLSIVLGLAIPPVPSASIACLVIILSAANIPAQDIALLFAVEWLLDRLRSGVIAVSHVFVAIVTDALCSSPHEEEKEDGQGQ